jgi:4'-phosphopantetheinyl transferase EntD
MMVDSVLLPHEQHRYHHFTAGEAGAPSDIGVFALWVFSMKEAFYKCVYPRCAKVFGFLDVDVSVDCSTRRFSVNLRTDRYPDVPATLPGRYQLDDKRIVCGVTWKQADDGDFAPRPLDENSYETSASSRLAPRAGK